MTIPIGAEKAFDKLSHLFVIRTLNKMGLRWKHLNIILAIYEKHSGNTIPNGEKLKEFL